MRSVARFRKIFSPIACLGLICAIVVNAWYPTRKSGPLKFNPKESLGRSDTITHEVETPEEKLFLVETQFMYGAVPLLEAYAKRSKLRSDLELTGSTHKVIETIRTEFREGFAASLVTALEKIPEAGSDKPVGISNLDRKRFIAAVWLQSLPTIEKLCYQLINSPGSEYEPEAIDQILTRSCDNFDIVRTDSPRPALDRKPDEPAAPAPLTLEEYETLRERLGWFAGMYQTTLISPSSAIARETVRTAMAASISLAKLIAVVMCFAVCSLIFGTILLVRSSRNRLIYRFKPASIDPTLIIETFGLYLAAMLVTPTILRYLAQNGVSFNALKVNLFAISALVLFVWWPRLWGALNKDIEESFGLDPLPWREFFRNVAAGPFGYIASIVPLFLTILVYSVFLQALNIHSSDGAHPIIPILTETKDNTTIYMIIFMAVVVAPFVEEIMFRGVFYSWLRMRSSSTAAIFISSLVFASVHPQGPIGVVPLTGIGIVLAFLREWRGSLVSPMLAHACFNAGTLALALNVLR